MLFRQISKMRKDNKASFSMVKRMSPFHIAIFWGLLLPVFFYAISPLQVVPGSGNKDMEDSKLYHFRYHNLVDDYHLSGPKTWAVRFNFKDAYPLADSASFTVNSFKIYSPYPNLEMRVSLWNEQYGGNNELNYFPGTIIPGGNWQNVTFSTSPATITFPEIQNPLQIIWLVMDFTLPLADKYMSASEGSGKNSFYYNTTVQGNEFWQSLFTAGFGCELRVSAIGDFNLLHTDLELLSFSLPENILPGSTVYPSVTVYNHSPYPVNDTLEVNFSDPLQELNQTLQIPLLNINPRDSLFTISPESISFAREPSQIKVTFAFKNHPNIILSTRYYNVFGETGSSHLVEYFRRYTFGISDIPQEASGVHHLLYFPNMADNLSNLFAVQRFNFYQFNSLPKTVVDGYKKFHLQIEANSEELVSAISVAQAKRSFISRSSCNIIMPDPETPENLMLNIKLYNDRTTLFEWTANSALNPKFFAGIFEENEFEGGAFFSLKKWLVFNESFSGTLNIRDSVEMEIILNTSDLDPVKAYRIYYWLQNPINSGGQIYYAQNVSLEQNWMVSNSDECIPHPVISVYPNPLVKGTAIKISSSVIPAVFTIYNIKGQKVFTTAKVFSEISIPADIFPASGIYFLRCETQDRGKTHKLTQKISIIK